MRIFIKVGNFVTKQRIQFHEAGESKKGVLGAQV
jgi:hypothetical protein